MSCVEAKKVQIAVVVVAAAPAGPRLLGGDAELGRELQQHFDARHERADLGEVGRRNELRVVRQALAEVAGLRRLHDLVQTVQRVARQLPAQRSLVRDTRRPHSNSLDQPNRRIRYLDSTNSKQQCDR